MGGASDAITLRMTVSASYLPLELVSDPQLFTGNTSENITHKRNVVPTAPDAQVIAFIPALTLSLEDVSHGLIIRTAQILMIIATLNMCLKCMKSPMFSYAIFRGF